MSDNEQSHVTQDRRLQTMVYDIDKKVHTLELGSTASQIEVSYLKGEIAGLRSSTASSFELKAASDLINQSLLAVCTKVDGNDKLVNERLDQIRKDVAGMRSVLLWVTATIVLAVIGALQFKLVVVP